MSKVAQKRNQGRVMRHRRVRKKVHGTAARPRPSPCSVEPAPRGPGHRRRHRPHARRRLDHRARPPPSAPARRSRRRHALGQLVAERAKAAGVERVVFDRGGFIYHGRIAALTTAARDAGLEF